MILGDLVLKVISVTVCVPTYVSTSVIGGHLGFQSQPLFSCNIYLYSHHTLLSARIPVREDNHTININIPTLWSFHFSTLKYFVIFAANKVIFTLCSAKGK